MNVSAPPSRPSVPSYMAPTTASRVTSAALRSSSTSSSTRQSEMSSVSQSRSSFRSTSNSRQSETTSSSVTKSSVRSLSASRQSESSRSSVQTSSSVARQSEARSSLRSSSGTRRAEVSSKSSSSTTRQQGEFSRSSSGTRQGEVSSARSSLRSSSATRHSELSSSAAYSRSSVRSTSASRQSEMTRSINSALRSNPMIDLIDLRSNSKENVGRSSRESSRPGSRSQLSSSSKENIGVSSRDIARSSSKENVRSNRDSLRSSSTENIKANVLGSRENVSRGLRENVVANKRRSARASTMSNFGGYWPSSAPPSFNSQLSEPGPGSKRESMLPPKSVSTSRENMRNSNANLSRVASHRSSFHESRSSFARTASKENVAEASRSSREAVVSSTKKRSVRASTISSLSEWSSTSKVRASNETRSSLATTNGDSINAALRANPMIELVDLRANSKENQGRSSRMNSSRESVKLPPKSGAACASSREHVVSSKKKSVRASTMSSLRELESIPKPPVMPSRDRSWGRSQQRVGGRDPSGSRSRPRPDNAPLESPRLSREVLAKLGNRQTKVVGHSGSGKMCAACEKPLTDDGFFAMGTLFHQACFRCGFCKKKLSQKYFTREDKPACAKCHKEAVYKCGVCQLKIPDDHIQVNKTYFHPRCMKCPVCDELQTSRYITYKDLPICEEDYKAIGHVCEECGSILTGELFTLMAGSSVRRISRHWSWRS